MSPQFQAIPHLIERLLKYSSRRQLLDEFDIPYVRNQLLQLFKCAEPIEGHTAEESDSDIDIDGVINKLINYGYRIGLIESNTTTYRDLLDAKIMGLLMPRPSQFIQHFNQLMYEQGIQAATEYFYQLSIASRYIRMDRVRLNPVWIYESSYGPLQITINLSKPEKDPAEIAKLKNLAKASYPKCLLCKENVGYEGRLDHPARQNLRLLPVQLQQEQWFLQYSPYVYYNEHSIVLNSSHTEMKISSRTFARLLDFVEQFPHYFIGSNADLPIVGGSILNHDHYQAGRHQFPMDNAKVIKQYHAAAYPDVTLSMVEWPLSVIRLQSAKKEKLLEVASLILNEWREYSDERSQILAYSVLPTGETISHNTITPIARIKDGHVYELDLVLRNNRTTHEHPYGIFHPHEHLHHIKKENIGLIEVMGLAILPARLKDELAQISTILSSHDEKLICITKEKNHPLYEHSEWIESLFTCYGWLNSAAEAEGLLRDEVGKKFAEVLNSAGVFKQNSEGKQAFDMFIQKKIIK